MANQLNNLPNYPTPINPGGATSKDWYFFLAGLYTGLAPETEDPIDVDVSPFVYVAPRGGFVIVQGGTVSAIEFSRDGDTFYNVAITQGIIPLCNTDQLRVTYSVLPTMTFVPT